MVCPTEAFNPSSPAIRAIEFVGSEFWDTQPWTLFSLRTAAAPSVPSFFDLALTLLLHHQHVDASNECHKCIRFQTCNHDTRDDADNHVTIFFIFTSVCSFTFGTEEDTCRVPWHACAENYNCLFLNIVFRLKNFLQSPDRCKKICFCPFPFITSLCANFCSEIHRSALKCCLVRDFLADASPTRDNSELSCLEYKSQYPRHGLS